MRKSGLTVIELLIALGITVFVMGVLIVAYVASTRIFNEEISKSSALLEANKAVNNLRKDLRSCLQIISASSTSISFWAEDLNSNGTREAGEIYSYSWSGTVGDPLIKTSLGYSYAIARSIRLFSLTYNTTETSAITKVDIKVIAGSTTNLATVETAVKLRNI